MLILKGGSDIPQYRKVGDRIIIRGAVETSWDGTNAKVLFNLPVGFRPARSVYKIIALQGTRLARLIVQNSGNVSIEWVAVIADGSSATGTYWFDISCDFEL